MKICDYKYKHFYNYEEFWWNGIILVVQLTLAKTCKTKPNLSKETIINIENARKRIKAGNFLTEEEARKRRGLWSIKLYFMQNL